MNIPPLWFWILGSVALIIAIILEIQTRRRMK